MGSIGKMGKTLNGIILKKSGGDEELVAMGSPARMSRFKKWVMRGVQGGGRESEGELRGGEEIKRSKGGFLEVDGGDDNGEGDIQGG
ncbi:hypothetical protein LINGRAHAP2_LOCUS14085 [Linum grandiflorum]